MSQRPFLPGKEAEAELRRLKFQEPPRLPRWPRPIPLAFPPADLVLAPAPLAFGFRPYVTPEN